MDIKSASEQIRGAVRAYLLKDEMGLYAIPTHMQRPIILLGPPGVGKTAIVAQIAQSMGLNFVSYSITHHTRQTALGLPFIATEVFGGVEHSVSEYTMSEIIAATYQAMERTGVAEGILFLDEINCVSETLAPAMLQFLQNKTFGQHQLPQGWVIVTAGNPVEYNRSAREFDPATMDRLKKIEVEPNLQVWMDYAQEHNIHPSIITYLQSKPSNFYMLRASVQGSKIVTPRGWEDLSKMLLAYEQLGLSVDVNLVAQYLQDEQIAQDFALYYELFCKYRDDYKITQILDGAECASIVQRAKAAAFDERVAIVSLLVDAIQQRIQDCMINEEGLQIVRSYVVEIKNSELAGLLIEQKLQQDANELATMQLLSKEFAACTCEREAVRAKAVQVLHELAADYGAQQNSTGYETLKVLYNAKCAAYSKTCDSCNESITNALRFLEEAFNNGQESLIFVSKLAVDSTSMSFLSLHQNEAYMKQNSSLIFDQRSEQIKAAIKEIDFGL